jgi:hypothetical protein
MSRHLSLEVFSIAIWIALVASTASAETVAVMDMQTTRMTTAHAQQVSDSGLGIVKEIRNARSSIARNDLRAAKHQVWKAMQLARKLKAQSPTEELRDRIEAAAKALGKNGKLDRQADLVPIYEQLDTVEIDHEDEIRTYLAQAEKDGTAGSAEKTEDLLVRAGADVGYMEVDLSLDKVVHDLRRAHGALSQPGLRANGAAADASLRDALTNVHVVMGEASVVLDGEDESDS